MPASNPPCDQEGLFRLILDCLKAVKPGVVDGFTPVTPVSLLGADLNLQSIEFVRIASAIQERLKADFLPFQDIFVTPEGTLVDDVTVQNVIDFLCGALAAKAGG
jgi:hypothetical protein